MTDLQHSLKGCGLQWDRFGCLLPSFGLNDNGTITNPSCPENQRCSMRKTMLYTKARFLLLDA
jgi:hypothetical protein